MFNALKSVSTLKFNQFLRLMKNYFFLIGKISATTAETFYKIHPPRIFQSSHEHSDAFLYRGTSQCPWFLCSQLDMGNF